MNEYRDVVAEIPSVSKNMPGSNKSQSREGGGPGGGPLPHLHLPNITALQRSLANRVCSCVSFVTAFPFL